MTKTNVSLRLLPLLIALGILAGCGGSQHTNPRLSSDNLNLIFVISEDVADNAPGDINPRTANLTMCEGISSTDLPATPPAF